MAAQSPATTLTLAPTFPRFRALAAAFWRACRAQPLLAIVGLSMIGFFTVAVIGLIADHQIITGAPAFLKPLKFAISTFIYVFTLLYLLTFINGHRRLVSIVTNVTAIGLVVELTLIFTQAIRGTTSHFNFTTPLDAAVYEVMAGFIVLVWGMGFVTALLLLRQRLADPAWAWALRLGMVIALVGMAVAVLMTQPTTAQLTGAEAGKPLTIIGAHTVGAPDGGPGIPLLGWSLTHGDLRIPHFFGLHGLQFMLIVGFLLLLARPWLDVRRRVALTFIAGVSYLGLVALLTWQALRGQSLVAPDGLTLLAFGALAGATLIAVGVVILPALRRKGVSPARSIVVN